MSFFCCCCFPQAQVALDQLYITYAEPNDGKTSPDTTLLHDFTVIHNISAPQQLVVSGTRADEQPGKSKTLHLVLAGSATA